jgi:hypothetical protein
MRAVSSAGDPYRTLGVDPSVPDAAVHSAYRRLIKTAHPDRNGGSADATRRFIEIQAAYEQILARRKQRRPSSTTRPRAGDPAVEARLADLERQVRDAQAARERAAQAARDALREVQGEEDIHLPADDEDTFSKLLADAAAELHDRVVGSREHPTVKRAHGDARRVGLAGLCSGWQVVGRARRAGRDDGSAEESGGGDPPHDLVGFGLPGTPEQTRESVKAGPGILCPAGVHAVQALLAGIPADDPADVGMVGFEHPLERRPPFVGPRWDHDAPCATERGEAAKG